MKKHPSFWIFLSLLLLAGAWIFWHQAGHTEAHKKFFAKPAIVTARSASTAPKIPGLTVPRNVVKAGASAVSTNQFAYRLSNTTKPIGELVRDGKAILLANALIDLRNPLNFSIPKNLQAQGDPGAYIVQANGPIDNAFRAMLAAAGATVVSYIPNDAYLVRASSGVANGIANNGFSVIPYLPYYKISAAPLAVRQKISAWSPAATNRVARTTLLDLAVNQKPLPAGTDLKLGLFADDAAATVRQIEKLGGKILSRDRSPFGPVVSVRPPKNWTALAQLSGVQIVEPAPRRTPANDLSRVVLGISTDTIVATNYMNLTGTNVIVEMNDSGVDATHPDLTGRVFGDASQSLVDTNGHGTHVAGIIAGSGVKSDTIDSKTNTLPQGSVLDPVAGNTDFRGKAPAAELYSVGGIEGDDTNVITDAYLQEQPALTNALISNNSWGYGDDGYDLAAASYDAAVRDALPGMTGSQPVLFVFAAGNDGGDNVNDGSGGTADTIESPGTAKDVITVGATEQLRNITNYVTALDGSSNQIWKPMTDTSYQVAGYSSRGNVGIGTEGTFGRFKPDVVAPGNFVVSTRSAQWDQAAYYNPTNTYELDYPDQTVSTNFPNYYSIDLSTTPNVVGITIQVVPNDFTVGTLNLPIYVSSTPDPNNFPDPTTPGTYFEATNTITIPPDGGAGYLVTAITNGGFNYAVGDSGTQPANYDLIVEITTTNDNGDYFQQLSNLNNTLGPYYRYETGTSMAAPAVSGMLALMQDFFTNTWHIAPPSPALFKAMLINGARTTSLLYDLQVQNSINFEGWGLANLPDSLPFGLTTNLNTACSMFIQDQSPTNALATGDSQTFTVNVSSNALAQPLRVTLAWTDPPGDPAAAVKLVNDLNLVVTNLDNPANPIIYYGNDISSGDFNNQENTNSPPKYDDINNVENVYLPGGAGTNFSVTVMGYRVNVNAVTAQTNNFTGNYAPNIVQDYALVISSGNGQTNNAIKVTASAPVIASNPSDQRITDVPLDNSTELLNQTVGANSPLLGTNTISFSTNNPEGIGPNNWQVTIGQTNQWHFYVVTNPPSNTGDFTNAAFVTFDPNTLSIPRTGVFADSQANATQPEADIDLYVAGPNDPNAASLTNLNPTVISNCVYGLNSDGASLGRGGTEFVVYSNSIPGEVYYVGVKSETQEASEYDFLPVFSAQPFSVMTNGVEYLTGVPLNAPIPGGNPAVPGYINVVGLAIFPIQTRNVVVANEFYTQDFGDLVGAVNHNDTSVILNNHDSINTPGTYTFVYDDANQGIVGSQHSDGPGSLNSFIGGDGAGVWILHEADNAEGFSNVVDSFNVTIQPHEPGDNSHTNTVQPNSWFYDYVDVPSGSTNLTVTVTNLTAATPPLELFVKYGALPTTNSFDEMTYVATNTIIPPELQGSISIGPPLTSGVYYFGVYNPSATAQQFLANWTVLPPSPVAQQIDYTSSGPAPILDDAVMTDSIPVSPGGTISSVNVGIAVQHPRISDLVFHLISPDGTRVLLMENRGGTSTDGAGGIATITTNDVLTSDFDTAAAGDYSGGTVAGWNVTGNQVSVVNDPTTANGGGGSSNFLALANGMLSTNLATVPGETYTLTFQYRGPGIVGWWRGENNYTDYSGYGNNPSAAPNVTFTNGEVGQAFGFNGNNSGMTIPASSSLNVGLEDGFTLETWVNPATFKTPGSEFALLEWNDNTGVAGVGTHMWLSVDHNVQGDGYADLYANIIDTGNAPHNFWSASGLMTTNSFQHVAVTYNHLTGLAVLYRNGLPVASTNLGIFTPQTSYPFYMGFRISGVAAGSVLDGDLDEASVYNRFLSPSEIQAIYADGTNGKFDTNEFLVSPPLSLAEAQINIPGFTIPNIFGNNTGWQTYTYSFTATGSSTPLQITGLEPGMLLDDMSVVSVVTNYNYLVFTEDTNLTTTPIKFAVPPFDGSSQVVTGATVMSDGFDNAKVQGGSDPAGAYAVGECIDGWLVEAGDVDVLDTNWGLNPFGIADSPPNCIDLSGNEEGTISTNFNTVVGQSYTLSFAFTKNPSPALPGYPYFVASAEVSITGQSSFQINTASTLTNSYNYLNWQHTNIVFTATSPTTTLQFASLNPGNGGMYLDTVKVSELDSGGLYYLPEQSLDAYAGENSAGNWLLEIQDDRAGAGLTNTLEGWQLQFTYTTATTSLTNSQTATNSLQPGGIAYYLVNVPTNADFATNFLFTTSGPLNFWFNESTQPSGTNSPGDYLLFNTSVNDSNVLSRTPSPTNIVSGGTYYLAVQNPNTFAVTNFAVQVNFHLFTVTNLVGGQPQTNTVDPGSFAYYAVSVPTNADIATNTLLFATGGPVNLLFNQTNLPTGLGAGDFKLLSASTGGSTNLTLAGTPPLVPGATYYLGVQNTNTVAVTFGIEVDFHLIPASPITNYPISGIVFTNIGMTNGILLTWYAPTNYQFLIQWTRSLSPPASWTTVPGVTLTNLSIPAPVNGIGEFQWFDDFSLTGGFGLLKFYRLIAYPPGVPVPPSLVISGIEALPGGGFQIQWTGSTNYNYEVLWTTNLALPSANWTALTNLNSPPLTLTYAGGVFTLDTGTLTTGAASAFFQVVELP